MASIDLSSGNGIIVQFPRGETANTGRARTGDNSIKIGNSYKAIIFFSISDRKRGHSSAADFRRLLRMRILKVACIRRVGLTLLAGETS